MARRNWFLRTLLSVRLEPVDGCGQLSESESSVYVAFVVKIASDPHYTARSA